MAEHLTADRSFGSTGLKLSPLSFGAMELRGPPRGRNMTGTEISRLLNAVVDGGITLIDTSIDYEASEERIGEHLGHRRDDFLLATKCGCLVGWERPLDWKGGMPGGGPHDFGPQNIRAGVEQSLRRLRTEYLDLIQLHASPSRDTLIEEDVIETLEALRSEGKVRFIGMSGVLPHLEEHVEMGAFDSFQVPFSLVQPEHGDVISKAGAKGAGVLVRGAAGRGVPAGRTGPLRKNPELGSHWQAVASVAAEAGIPPMELTLRYSLGHPGVSSLLVGTADQDHLMQNVLAASKGPLPPDLHQRLVSALRDGSDDESA
jgi:aryl-alcohol dehydrogenase-like predicted oxidoreductase